MADDRKIKLVIKDHYCSREGELASWASFDCVSRINDVGNAVLVSGYIDEALASDEGLIHNERLDALAVGDTIIQAYIQPPGHTRFLSTPAWEGFLRDRKVRRISGLKAGQYKFKDFNHLLLRRQVEPPEGASHDEKYGTTDNIMRQLVREHAAEEASDARRMPGLNVEGDDEDESSGLYGGDTSLLVFGQNAPDWVRVNCLYEWNGNLYLGTETQSASGAYAAIYRSADGVAWTQVMDGTPGIYVEGVTGVHCFAEFDGALWAGCSQDWQTDDAVLLRTVDGADWTLATTLDNHTGIWALCEFNGEFFAGTGGYTGWQSETYLWKSADGFNWTAVADALVSTGCPCAIGAGMNEDNWIVCESLYEWDGFLYIGIQYKYTWCFCGTQYGSQMCLDNSVYNARIYRTDDGINLTLMHTVSAPSAHGVLSFHDFNDILYAGTGRTRWTDFPCGVNVDYATGGQILATTDGSAWTQVFGSNLESTHKSSAISAFSETLNADGETVLWACSGWRTGGYARIYQTQDGAEWVIIATLPAIPYAFTLDIANFLGSDYAATGCYAKVGEWRADHGDVWRIAALESSAEEAGVVGRWVSLLEKLRELAEQSGEHDFGVVGQDSTLYCYDEVQNFQFQVRNPQWGDDNRWDEDTGTGVVFQVERRNMENPEQAEIRGSRPTFLYVLGPSAGEEREVDEFFSAEWIDESPWSRIEGTVDAQGVDSPSARASVGRSEVELQGPERTLEFQVAETNVSHFNAGDSDCAHPLAWGLGDIVTAQFLDSEAICKIVEVSISARGPAYQTGAVFDILEIVEPEVPFYAYAATEDSGLFYSEDFLFDDSIPTWERLGQVLTMDCFAIDRARPSTFQACQSGDEIYVRVPALYADDDFHKVLDLTDASALTGQTIQELAWVEINASKPGYLYTMGRYTFPPFLTGFLMFRSSDYGQNWEYKTIVNQIHRDMGQIQAGYQGGEYDDGEVLYAVVNVTSGGEVRVYYSLDNGDTWALKDDLGGSNWLGRVLVDPTNQSVTYAGDSTNGPNLAKATTPSADYVVVKTGAGITIRTAYGTGWVSADDSRYVRTARTGTLYYTGDGGLTWKSIAAPYTNQTLWGADEEPGKIASFTTDSGTVGLPHVLKATDDLGVTWYDKGGATPDDVNTIDSIPYNCGGCAENGLFIYQAEA